MQVTPVTARCQEIWRRRPAIVLGISPFNSYFSRSRIEALSRWALTVTGEVYYFVPDGPSAYTLAATGTPPDRAMKQAAKQGRYLRNKIRDAHRAAGHAGPFERHLLDSARLRSCPAYQRQHEAITRNYMGRPGFRSACRDASAWVIGRDVADDASVDLAVKYLLAEFPLFLHAEAIIGQPSAAFVYKHCPPVVEETLTGMPPASRHTAFVRVEPLSSAARPSVRVRHQP